MKRYELNTNDKKLLAYCYNQSKHLSDIARHIGIDIKNVSTRVDRLKKLKLINIDRIKNRKYIRTVSGVKTNTYLTELLEQLNEAGGEMSEDDFLKLLPFSFGKEEDYDKFDAPLTLMFMYPPLVDRYIKINKRGERFLKDKPKHKGQS